MFIYRVQEPSEGKYVSKNVEQAWGENILHFDTRCDQREVILNWCGVRWTFVPERSED